ncbi:class B sortase [Eggerthellaceae bacterium zg-1084]|uniref:Class B sortase n=1 Tax=Berryella wangjianweii TaxID=2734634 RepID=A0A6M8J0V1_9ACTN|nr:class B sortase [Berryella wangjianweii]NPD30489.1 class B sortase [Berryella wangjianweii]NPD32792.1 class B sortase [Eggerthellaceae bacterium zg-997]QKF07154.1 class B sortase [Berryella wangjianweii]
MARDRKTFNIPQGAPGSAGDSAFMPATPPANRGGGKNPFNGRHAKQPKKSAKVWNVVFYVAIVVLVGSLITLGALVFSYWQGQQVYRQVIEQAGVNLADIEKSPEELPNVKVNWDRLLEINPQTVAWLYVPGTNINYPVVQGTDNDYWLTHDFEGKNGWLAQFGTVFQDYRNSKGFTDQANFIFGHHLNDGSMFSAITEMTKRETFDAQRVAYLFTPKGNYRLRTFALLHVGANDPLIQPSFPDEQSYQAYVQDKIDRSLHHPSDLPALSSMNKLFAFGTCDNLITDGRYVLYAYLEQSTTGQTPKGGEGLGMGAGAAEEVQQAIGEKERAAA